MCQLSVGFTEWPSGPTSRAAWMTRAPLPLPRSAIISPVPSSKEVSTPDQLSGVISP